MNHSVQLTILSSLEKVFQHSDVSDLHFRQFSMLKNERSSFQAAYQTNCPDAMDARLEIVSPIAEHIHAYQVKLIPARNVAAETADDYYITKESGEFPDLLTPIEDDHVTLQPGGVYALWFEVKAESELPAGDFDITVTLRQDSPAPAVLASASLTVRVIDALLPRQTLIYTNWFHTDCLASYYKVPVFSEDYWSITENYLKRAREFGMNMVLTPVFTPPLDTQAGGERPTVQLVDVTVTDTDTYSFGFERFDRWVDLCDRCGIDYYEISHFFTQWGAEHAPKIMAHTPEGERRIFGWETDAFGSAYSRFLHQFASAFTSHLDQKGLRGRCFFHVSDEPEKDHLEAYKKASTLVHDCFPGFRFIDALSDFDFYQQKLVDTPIPSNDHIEPFIGNVPELWTYYCCSQNHDYVSNRFFSMPSQRNRVLGYQLYKFHAAGFLHWAFNFWFAQFSVREIDPFTESDADGNFYSGDSYVVYPGADGTPLDSLRLHVFYDALQDMMALQLLESRIGRDAVIKLLESETEKPLTFSEYPHSSKWQLETREKINQAICLHR